MITCKINIKHFYWWAMRLWENVSVKFRHKRDGIFSNGLWSASPKIKSLVKSVHEPAPKSLGAFHKKNLVIISQTRPRPPHVWLLYLQPRPRVFSLPLLQCYGHPYSQNPSYIGIPFSYCLSHLGKGYKGCTYHLFWEWGCPYHHITAILEDDWGRGCCTCKQDTEKRYSGQQFCQNEKGHFVPTNQRWSQIFRLDGTLMESGPSCGPRIWVNAMVGLLKKPLFNWEFIESVHSVGSQEQGSRRYFADVTKRVKITSGTRL